MTEKRPFLTTSLFVILGRSAGFLIPFFIAVFYGANVHTDAFFFAFGIVFFLTGLIARVFESVLIPYLAACREDEKKGSALTLGVTLLSYIGTAICFFGVWFLLKPFLQYTSRVSPEFSGLSVQYFVEMAPLLFLGVWIAMCDSIFNSRKIFWFPSLSPFVRSVVTLAFMFAAYRSLHMQAVTAGYAAGEIVRFVLTVWLLKKLVSWRFSFDMGRIWSEIKSFWGKVSFQVLGIAAVDMLPFVDQWFASRLAEGNLSILNYADRLMLVAEQLFFFGVAQVFLSYWSEQYEKSAPADFASKVRRDILWATLIATAVSIPAWLLRGWVVQLLFGHSNLDAAQLRTLADLMGWLIIGFIPGVVNLLYVRVLFVMKRSVFYCNFSWVQLGLKLILTFLLMPPYGVIGIALATLITYTVTVLWLHFYLRKHWELLARP